MILDGSKSGEEPVQSGVPHGSVLGPLLMFILFINDLPNNVSNASTKRMFADDCDLYRPINTDQDTRVLQQDLGGLQRWGKD